jgi:hypothetical protein
MRRRYSIIISALIGVFLLAGAYFLVPTIFGSIIVPLPDQYKPMLEAAAKQFNVDTCLGAATIEVESGWNPDARSGSGAIGLGQIIYGTFVAIGNKNNVDISKGPYDPQTNINVMMAYEAYNTKLYGANLRNLAVAYNGGGGLVSEANWELPLETQFYITKISRYYQLYSTVYPDFCTGPGVSGGPTVGAGANPVSTAPAFPVFNPSPEPTTNLSNFWKNWLE